MNKLFEVLVWEKYENKDQLGQPKTEKEFETYKEAYNCYEKIGKFLCKMIMQYKTIESDSDGDVIDEEWDEE